MAKKSSEIRTIGDPANKIKRDARKAGREAKRDSKSGDIVSKESGRYGIDLSDLQKSPIGDEAKKRITEGVSKATNAEKWGVTDKITGFQKAAPGLSLEDRPELDKKALKESARKQRRSAWVDALTAFGQGVTTGRVDPESLRSTKFKRERDIEFQNYRDITERNKETRNLWEHQNRNELLNFVEKQITDEKVASADRIKYQQIADQITAKNTQWEAEFGLKERRQTLSEDQLKARKEGKYYTQRPKSKTKPTKSKTRYTDKFYELSGNSPAVINELAKITGGYAVDDDGNLKRSLNTAEAERLSNTLIKRMFKEDAESGELVPIPGMENYIDDLSNSIEQTKAKQTELDNLQTEQYEKVQAASNRWKEDDIKEEYDAKINQAKTELQQIKSDTRNLMEGNVPQTSQSTSQEKLDEFFK